MNDKTYFTIEILQLLSENKKLLPNKVKEKLKAHFKETISKNDFGEDEFKIKDNEKFYYMYKEVNKNTIETLINRGVYKNKVENFNDPFDPYFKKYNTILDEELKDIRITCFSTTSNNILLWSHYGNNHKGICLGYEIDETTIKENEKIILKKVLYKGIETEGIKGSQIKIEDMEIEDMEIESIDLQTKKDKLNKIQNTKLNIKEVPGMYKPKNRISISEVFLKKHENWMYENEYRLIHLNTNLSENYFKELKLKEVIFGIDTLESDKKLIKEILKGQDVKFYKIVEKENLKIEKELE